MGMKPRHCKDCLAEWVSIVGEDAGLPRNPRPIVPESGGRCATHWRQEKLRRKLAAHEKRVQRVYGLSEGDYGRLYAAQGGRCYLCQRANGASKKLAVDHDHDSGLVYGLLCGPCNKDVMGRSRRDVEYFRRCIRYLLAPPAKTLGIVAYHEENRNG